jgi:hypothetical protein
MRTAVYNLPRHLKLYVDASYTSLRVDELVRYVSSILPSLDVEVRPEPARFFIRCDREMLEFAREVSATRVFRINSNEVVCSQFEAEVEYEYRRIKQDPPNMLGTFYSAYHLQDAYWKLIPASERGLDYVHVVITKLLIGTFDNSSGRWHARTIALGFPNIISLRGLIEAPAKPRQFYILRQTLSMLHAEMTTEAIQEAIKSFALVDLEDERLTEVTKGYLLQAIAYHATMEPFCNDASCRLFNAHWQQEMLRAQLNGEYELCEAHSQLFRTIESMLSSTKPQK